MALYLPQGFANATLKTMLSLFLLIYRLIYRDATMLRQPFRRLLTLAFGFGLLPHLWLVPAFATPDDDNVLPAQPIPISVTGAITQQKMTTMPPTAAEAGLAYDKTLLGAFHRVVGEAGGFAGPHYDFMKLRLTYLEPQDVSFCSPLQTPEAVKRWPFARRLNLDPQRSQRHLVQLDLKLNFEDVRGVKRLALPANNLPLECELVSYAQHGKARGRLGKRFLLYQPTANVVGLQVFAPGNSEGAWMKVLQGLLGIGRDLGVLSTTFGTVR